MEIKMTNYYVLKLLENGGVYRADTVVYGDVEIRPPRVDYKDELEAIKKSIEPSEINLDFICRIGTIVNCDSIEEAELLADEKFVSILDLLSSDFYISRIGITQFGYTKNLSDGEITPIQSRQFTPRTCFIVKQSNFIKYDFNHWIVNQKTDLSDRYKRSIHWSRRLGVRIPS
jgi:hypothetical protein